MLQNPQILRILDHDEMEIEEIGIGVDGDRNRKTALFCVTPDSDTSYALASATLTQCQQLGFQVPDDISIIGFDDLPIAACTSPPLTTIRQDRLELGKSGFFALSSLLNHIPISTYLLHAQLIQRESTGKVPS